jgi:3-phosphoshikimate 1-carboxyvinyltransferase
MKIRPAKTIKGTLSLPGDKSISHRAAILAALAEGTTRIENFAPGADCASTLSCLRQLGVEIERDGDTVIVHGVGMNGLKAPTTELDCGNSGTTMRLLAGVLAGQNFTSTLTGDESLSKRPMQRIVEPLTQMGAEIESTAGHAPLKIIGKHPLKAISYKLPKPSAQLKSCILLAGLFADGETTVVESIPTRDHTERMLPHFAVKVGYEEKEGVKYISVSDDAQLIARDLIVPGDISSAAFFMVAAACLKDSELTLRDLGINPLRGEIINLLRQFGADIQVENERSLGEEPVGDVTVRGVGLHWDKDGIVCRERTASLIDEIPIAAVFSTQIIGGGVPIHDAEELRVKESDRIKSVVKNLRSMGAYVDEFPDGLHAQDSKLKGAVVDPFGDHRIAMAFAVAGLLAEGETEILNAECVDISYPGFFETLERLTQ